MEGQYIQNPEVAAWRAPGNEPIAWMPEGQHQLDQQTIAVIEGADGQMQGLMPVPEAVADQQGQLDDAQVTEAFRQFGAAMGQTMEDDQSVRLVDIDALAAEQMQAPEQQPAREQHFAQFPVLDAVPGRYIPANAA